MQEPPPRLLLRALAMGLSVAAWGKDEATTSSANLTPDTALKAAQAALKTCRDAGFNAAVAVADRGGVTQVMIRATGADHDRCTKAGIDAILESLAF